MRYSLLIILTYIFISISTIVDAQVTLTIGDGTITNEGNSYPAPYGNYYTAARHGFLIHKYEILGQGGGTVITGLAFDVVTPGGAPIENLTIYMANTNSSLGDWSFDNIEAQEVYNASSFTEQTGWNVHNFTTPFVWDGVSRLYIEVCLNNSSYTTNAVFNQSSTYYTSSIVARLDNIDYCPFYVEEEFNQRPNMQLVFEATPDNAYLQEVVNPVNPQALGLTDIIVDMVNFGSNNLISANIGYSINGVVQSNYDWSGNLPTMDDENITIGNYNFPIGAHDLKVWVSQPNGNTDTYPINDTIEKEIVICESLNGSYTIGSGGSFNNFTDAIYTLNHCGVTGPVVLNILPGTYNETLQIGEINGVSSVNTVTFQSSTQDSSDVIIQNVPSYSNLVILDNSHHIIFKHLTFRPIYDGTTIFDILGSDSIRIEECLLDDQNDEFTNAIKYSGNSVSIINCKILNFNVPILVNMSALGGDCIIEGNTIKNFTGKGINITQSGRAIISNNYFRSPAAFAKIIYCESHGPYEISSNIIEIEESGWGIWAGQNAEFLISNNFITILGGVNISSGIYLFLSQSTKILNNNINIVSGCEDCSCIHIVESGSPDSPKIIKNNIGTIGTEGYAIYVDIFNNFESSLTDSDYNCFDIEGSNFAYFGGDVLNTLTDWQTYTNGFDTHSIVADPQFVSATDLHTQSSELYAQGVHVAEVDIDIDGELRGNTPDIGADEHSPVATDIVISQIVSPLIYQSPGVVDVSIIVENLGLNNVYSFETGWSIDNGPANIESHSVSLDNLEMTDEINLGQFNMDVQSRVLRVWTSQPNDEADGFAYNDTIEFTITNPPIVTDIAISQIVSPLNNQSPGVVDVSIMVENLGLNNVYSFKTGWSIDNGAANIESHSISLDHLETTGEINLGQFNMDSQSHLFRVWTFLPNDEADGLTYNDTIEFTITNPPVISDIAISQIVSPLTNQSSGVVDVSIKVENLGLNNVYSFETGWSIDNGPANIESHSVSLNNLETTGEINLGQFNMDLQPLLFKVWTSLPNNETDGVACNDTIEFTITPSTVGILDMSDGQEFAPIVYPSPASKNINIIGGQKYKAQIINTNGQKLESFEIDNSPYRINIEHFTPGVYIIQLSNNNKLSQIKFIKE